MQSPATAGQRRPARGPETGGPAALRQIVCYGVAAGLLILAMRLVEYRFLVVEHSVEIYGAIIAASFAAVGIWLGLTITKETVVVREVAVERPGPFLLNLAKVSELGLTPRELEVLRLIADGLSTREMAERLFVSENTVKTHCSRVLGKLGVNRRTQAVQVGQAWGLIP